MFWPRSEAKYIVFSLAEQFYSAVGENFEESIEKIAFFQKKSIFSLPFLQTLTGSSPPVGEPPAPPQLAPRKNRSPMGAIGRLPTYMGELTALKSEHGFSLCPSSMPDFSDFRTKKVQKRAFLKMTPYSLQNPEMTIS